MPSYVGLRANGGQGSTSPAQAHVAHDYATVVGDSVCAAAGNRSAASTHDSKATIAWGGDTTPHVIDPTWGTGVLGSEGTPLLRDAGAYGAPARALVGALHNSVVETATKAAAFGPSAGLSRKVLTNPPPFQQQRGCHCARISGGASSPSQVRARERTWIQGKLFPPTWGAVLYRQCTKTR